MIDDVLVIDGVAHAFDMRPESYTCELSAKAADVIYYGLHVGLQPPGVSTWILDRERFLDAADADLVGHALFAESATDMCVYHAIDSFGLLKNGLSPLRVGLEMRERYPGRVLVYGPVSPWQDGVLDEIDRLAQEDEVDGLKIYPHDIVDGKVCEFRIDNPEVAHPVIERARANGIRNIALQKAQPIAGPVPMGPYNPLAVEGVALEFPDVMFELIHGGWAFLEETSQMLRLPNVAVNLESTSAYLVKAPRRFAEILGTLLQRGSDRITWGTGAMLFHPRPLVEAFWDFEMPRDLVEDYGMPELTREAKAKILGANQARLLGLDVEVLQRNVTTDGVAPSELAPPWSGGKQATAASGGTA